MNETAKLLPIAKLCDGREMLIDLDMRQFRNFRDADDVIEMHSEKGKQILKEMKGNDWNSYGLSTGAIF